MHLNPTYSCFVKRAQQWQLQLASAEHSLRLDQNTATQIISPFSCVQATLGRAASQQEYTVRNSLAGPYMGLLVVCALGRYLLRPRWVLCWLICACRNGGTRCGVICVWYLR